MKKKTTNKQNYGDYIKRAMHVNKIPTICKAIGVIDKKLYSEILEALIEFMTTSNRCASFNNCADSDRKCIMKGNCRFLKTAKLIEKATGMTIDEVLK
jgi:hypothetical protein